MIKITPAALAALAALCAASHAAFGADVAYITTPVNPAVSPLVLKAAPTRALPAARAASGIDAKGPKLTAFAAAPQAELGTASGRINFTWAVTDNFSGFTYGYASFVSPDGMHGWSVPFGDRVPAKIASGTDAFSPGQFAAAGTWSVSYVVLLDNNGNQTSYDAAALAAFGNTHVAATNSNGVDMQPPTLAGGGRILTPTVSQSEPAPGTTATPQLAVIDVHLLDTAETLLSGVQGATATFCQIGTSTCFYAYSVYGGLPVGLADADLRLSGVPNNVPPGTYALAWLYVSDNANSSAAYVSTDFGGTTDFTQFFGRRLTIAVAP